MRTDAQISKIKETQSASLQLNNFVDTSVIFLLKNKFFLLTTKKNL